MNNKIIQILQLPERCILNKKITKAFFKRNFDLTSSEKNLLDDYNAITAIDWIASISQMNANVPAFNEAEASYEEIQVILVTTSPEGLLKLSNRIIDLVQKYIPYHILLVISDDIKTIWNACYKKINLIDNNKRTLVKKFTSNDFALDSTNKIHNDFLSALNFTKLVSNNLKLLYEGYIQCIVGLSASKIIGEFGTRTQEQTREDVERMEQITFLEKEIVTLSNIAQKESQLNVRIELNTKIQHNRKQIELLKNKIIQV